MSLDDVGLDLIEMGMASLATDPREFLGWLTGKIDEAEQEGRRVRIYAVIALGDQSAAINWSGPALEAVTMYQLGASEALKIYDGGDEFEDAV